MKISEPLTDHCGFKYYDHLPEGFRLATREDYPGSFTQGRAFLIKRDGKEYYECHRAKVPVKKKIVEFILENRVYLYDY